MQIHSESYGHVVILILEGEQTADTLDALRQAVEGELANNDVIDVVLNLEKVPFIDSAVLEYLLDLRENLSERLGEVKFIKPDENIRKVLEITHLDSEFQVFDDASAAMKVM